MALIECDFFSEVLGKGCSMAVILPQPLGVGGVGNGGPIGMGSAPSVEADRGTPTLWLLHGLSDDHSAWTRRTAVERYVSGMNLAVVMPNVDRSYYADMASGLRYWTFVSQELPAVARRFFRLSDRREDNFAAGLSMGGYGALKLALNFPERYAAAASLSGAVDPAALGTRMPERSAEWGWMFGDPPRIENTAADLFAKSRQLAEGEHRDMPLYLCCGTGDFLYQDNLRFRAHLRGLDLNLTYEEHPDEVHEWGYWDRQIRRVLDWLPLDRPTG